MTTKEPRSHRIDKLTNQFATNMSKTFTRRGMVCRLGYYVAGFFGVSFAHAVVTSTAFGQTSDECTHETEEPDACEKKSGVKCGFNNSKDCAKFKDNDTCEDCKIDEDGCPDGTHKGTDYWKSCCLCKEDDMSGEYFEYWDCCGTIKNDCVNCMNVGGCSNIPVPCETGSNESWCGDTGGAPECTYVVATGEDCTPS